MKYTARDLERDLAEGRISEEEYKRRKKILERIDRLEEDLINGRITEEQFRSRRNELMHEIFRGPSHELPRPTGPQPPALPSPPPERQLPPPPPPPLAPVAPGAEVRRLAAGRAEIERKRRKLRGLLESGKISERTFEKLDLELREKLTEVVEKLRSLRDEIERRLSEVKAVLEEKKLEREEKYARMEIGDITREEYEGEEARISREIKGLEEEAAQLEEALKAIGEES